VHNRDGLGSLSLSSGGDNRRLRDNDDVIHINYIDIDLPRDYSFASIVILFRVEKNNEPTFNSYNIM